MISPLLTDLYQLTMAYGYWKLGIHDREAVFHLIFRKYPFQSHYAIACGLGSVIDFLKNFHFSNEDLTYLETLKAPTGSRLFPADFLNYLKTLRFTCDIDAIPEGTLVFPHEPLLRIKGPLLQGQLLESTLLNLVNFQTLIATKASRVCLAAKGDSVLEFGMRRAQGPDGALSASRAAFIGGCEATSNVLAGQRFGIPVCGTHAHSWVTAFDTEKEAFAAYAEVMPDNCILLVDTYDTLRGVKNAIEIGRTLQKRGAELRGIRLDSGDFATLSKQARQLLDQAGFVNTKIIASNSLDEYVIEKLKQQGAPIDIWGVGTNLVTAYDHPALDGVYKLSALKDANGKWQYKIKLSEQTVKVSNPGIYQVRRFFVNGKPAMDVMYDVELGMSKKTKSFTINEPHEMTLVEESEYRDLLVPIFKSGELIYTPPSIKEMRKFAIEQATLFSTFSYSNSYSVGLENKLHDMKQKLIIEVRDRAND